MSDIESRLYFEAPTDSENCLLFVATKDGGVDVTAADEVAFDSYNAKQDISFHLSRRDAAELLEWLTVWLKPTESAARDAHIKERGE